MKKILIFVVALMIGFPVNGAAEEKSSFLSEWKQLESSFSGDPNSWCVSIWNTVWPWAKKGDLEARAVMSSLLYSGWPGFPQIFMPGRAGDELSSMRDSIILHIHSLGYKFPGRKKEDDDPRSQVIYKFLEGSPRGMVFLSCLQTESPEHCKEVSSGERKLVPDFEQYSIEIDALIAQGLKPTCVDLSLLKPDISEQKSE